MTTINQAKSIITRGIVTKSQELLVLENSTIRQIRAAYETARDEVARELNARWNKYLAGAGRMTEQQIQLAKTKLFRDAKLYENLESRIGELGGKVDKITASAIMEATGISNEWVEREFQSMCAFTNLDPSTFALINRFQAEVAMNKVNEGTKFVNEVVKKDTLGKMRDQIRIGVLKGESIDSITARIVSKTPLTLEGVKQGVFSSVEQRARLNARWGVIESANNAAITQYGSFNDRVSKAGLEDMQLMKQVTAQIDNRTTVTCSYANGQIQPLDQPFETDQGLLDYPPFHPNCRTTVTAWHQAFEAYGKSTKDMVQESKDEMARRNKAWDVKHKGQPMTQKQRATRKSNLKTQSKVMKATEKTVPSGNWDMPSMRMQERLANLPSDQAMNILSLETNEQRAKALIEIEDSLGIKIKESAIQMKPFQKSHTLVRMSEVDSQQMLINEAKAQGYKITQAQAKEAIEDGLRQFSGTNNCADIRSAQQFYKKTGVWTDDLLKAESDHVEDFIKWSYDYDDKQVLFRSIQGHGKEFLKRAPGDVVDMMGTSSWSTDADWSYRMFGGQDQPIFILKGGASRGLSATTQSCSVSGLTEQEVIISMEQKYRIISEPVKMKIKDIPELHELEKSFLDRTATGASNLMAAKGDEEAVVVYLEAY